MHHAPVPYSHAVREIPELSHILHKVVFFNMAHLTVSPAGACACIGHMQLTHLPQLCAVSLKPKAPPASAVTFCFFMQASPPSKQPHPHSPTSNKEKGHHNQQRDQDIYNIVGD